MQYLHIQTYLLIQAIPIHTGNTYIYLCILATMNTYSYMQYLQILCCHCDVAVTCNTYRYCHITADTCNTYRIPAYIGQYPDIPVDTLRYMLIHVYTYHPELETAIFLQPTIRLR